MTANQIFILTIMLFSLVQFIVYGKTTTSPLAKASKTAKERIIQDSDFIDLQKYEAETDNMGYTLSENNPYVSSSPQEKRKGKRQSPRQSIFDVHEMQEIESAIKDNNMGLNNGFGTYLSDVAQERSKNKINTKQAQGWTFTDAQGIQGIESPVKVAQNRRKNDGITTRSSEPKLKGPKVTTGKENLGKLSGNSAVPGRNSPVNVLESFDEDIDPVDESEMADEDQSEFLGEIDQNLPGMPSVIRIFATIFKAIGAFISAIKQILRGPLSSVNTGQPQPNQYQSLQSVVNTGRQQANQYR